MKTLYLFYTSNMTSPSFYIKILLLVLAIYILNSELQKRETSPDDFLREITITDVQPVLDQGNESDSEREDWWYGAVLNGDNGKNYKFKLLFENIPRIRVIFIESNKNTEHTEIDCTNYDMEKTSQGAILNCTFPDGYAKIVVTPENSNISILLPKIKLELSFKSRGLPYWFKNSQGFKSGYENPAEITGSFTENGKEIQLQGYGLSERVLFNMSEYESLSYTWISINFDQGYAFLFGTTNTTEPMIKDALVFVDGKYSYVKNPNNIIAEYEGDITLNKISLVINTEYGNLEVSNGVAKFIYKNGDILQLTNKVSLGCFVCYNGKI